MIANQENIPNLILLLQKNEEVFRKISNHWWRSFCPTECLFCNRSHVGGIEKHREGCFWAEYRKLFPFPLKEETLGARLHSQVQIKRAEEKVKILPEAQKIVNSTWDRLESKLLKDPHSRAEEVLEFKDQKIRFLVTELLQLRAEREKVTFHSRVSSDDGSKLEVFLTWHEPDCG